MTPPDPAGPSRPDDALALRLRLVELLFTRAFGPPPDGIWYAPCPLILFGGAGPGPTLAVTTHWRVMVAARARDDAALRMACLDRPEFVNVRGEGAESTGMPADAVAVSRMARALGLRGHGPGGADLFASADVPYSIGLAVPPALRVAAGKALAGISGLPLPDGELGLALSHAGGADPAHAACLGGRAGHAMLVPGSPPGPIPGSPPGPIPGSPPGPIPGSPTVGVPVKHTLAVPRQVQFGPPAARIRLVVISLRVSRGATAPGAGDPVAWEAAPEDARAAEDARAVRAFEVLCHEPATAIGRELGLLLSAAHADCRAGRGPVEADRAAASAMAAGALGARVISPCAAVVIVATDAVRAVRGSVAASFAELGQATPRFLTTAAVAQGAHPDAHQGPLALQRPEPSYAGIGA